jgi:hypothetical protein
MGHSYAQSRYVLAAMALFVITRIYILFAFEPQASDVSVYFGTTFQAAELGRTPYSRELPIEFPPLAWWTMAAARKLSDSDLPPQPALTEINYARAAYAGAFRSIMAAADVISFALFVAIVRRRRAEMLPHAAIVYVIATALLAHVLYDRLDSGVLLMLLSTFYFWLRSSASGPHDTAWRIAAYVTAGLGVAFKIVPVLVLPFLWLNELTRPSPTRMPGPALAAVLAGILLPFGVQFLISGPGVLHLVGFHTGRGVQLESMVATIMAAGRWFGYPATLELWEGGVNLTGELASPLIATSYVALAAMLCGLAYCCLRRGRTADEGRECRIACLAVAGSVIVSKVFSPQYLIWAIPLLLLASVELLRTRRGWWLASAAVLAIAALTSWLFPHHYFNFRAVPFGLEPIPVPRERIALSFVIVGLRNAIYLSLIVALTMRLLRQEPITSGPAPVRARSRRGATRASPSRQPDR